MSYIDRGHLFGADVRGKMPPEHLPRTNDPYRSTLTIIHKPNPFDWGRCTGANVRTRKNLFVVAYMLWWSHVAVKRL